jgi:hypothetical protein
MLLQRYMIPRKYFCRLFRGSSDRIDRLPNHPKTASSCPLLTTRSGNPGGPASDSVPSRMHTLVPCLPCGFGGFAVLALLGVLRPSLPILSMRVLHRDQHHGSSRPIGRVGRQLPNFAHFPDVSVSPTSSTTLPLLTPESLQAHWSCLHRRVSTPLSRFPQCQAMESLGSCPCAVQLLGRSPDWADGPAEQAPQNRDFACCSATNHSPHSFETLLESLLDMFALALPLVFGAAHVAASLGVVDLGSRSLNVASLTADDVVFDFDTLAAPFEERDAFDQDVGPSVLSPFAAWLTFAVQFSPVGTNLIKRGAQALPPPRHAMKCARTADCKRKHAFLVSSLLFWLPPDRVRSPRTLTTGSASTKQFFCPVLTLRGQCSRVDRKCSYDCVNNTYRESMAPRPC